MTVKRKDHIKRVDQSAEAEPMIRGKSGQLVRLSREASGALETPLAVTSPDIIAMAGNTL